MSHAKRSYTGKSRRLPGAVGYVRVSTEEQADSGAGLLAQRAQIEAEVRRRGWELIELVEDAGHSGRSLRRPGITHVLDLLAQGTGDVLVVAKLDRLSRSMVDFALLMERSRTEGWGLVALDVAVDTSTPAGEAMAAVMQVFAQLERRLVSQRTREALAVKRAQGVVLGRPRVLPDGVVRRIVTERAMGYTLAAIASGLEADGVPTAHGGRWRTSTVHGVLRSRSALPLTRGDRDAA